MKKYQIEVKGLKLEIVQDNDGKFVTPDIVKEYEKVGSALKPSFEPIIIARKPFSGTLVDNILENGVGGINIDECRVGEQYFEITNGEYDNNENQSCFGNIKRTPKAYYGRYPANTILTYNDETFDEVCSGFPSSKSTDNIRHNNHSKTSGKGIYGKFNDCDSVGYADSGSSARFYKNCPYEDSDIWDYLEDIEIKRYFYSGKASKRDRDEGTENRINELELSVLDEEDKELWKGIFTTREEEKVVADMVISLKRAIEEYGMQTKKGIGWNTMLYGKTILEKSLKESKYTTKMGISSTTISQILNWLALWNIKENIQNVNFETELNINLAENVVNISQLQIIIKENKALAHGANNAVLKMRLKIRESEGRNIHSTVKPTSLMAYLVRLVTPKGGTILDPFNGSGSTGKAVMRENKERNANYKYIGIEMTDEYLPISKARIEFEIPNCEIRDFNSNSNEIEAKVKESQTSIGNKQISMFD